MKTKSKTKLPKKLTLAQEIARRNKVWAVASNEQKRRIMTQEALDMIRKKKFEPYSGRYCQVFGAHAAPSDDLQVVLLREHGDVATCECCAKGALFLGRVRWGNNATVHDAHNMEGAANEIPEWPPDNLHLIETAYEGVRYHGMADHAHFTAKAFHELYWTEDDVDGHGDRTNTTILIAILKNILKSKDALFHPETEMAWS